MVPIDMYRSPFMKKKSKREKSANLPINMKTQRHQHRAKSSNGVHDAHK